MPSVAHNIQAFVQFKSIQELSSESQDRLVEALKKLEEEESITVIHTLHGETTWVFRFRYPPRIALSRLTARLRFLSGNIWQHDYQITSGTSQEEAERTLKQLAEMQ